MHRSPACHVKQIFEEVKNRTYICIFMYDIETVVTKYTHRDLLHLDSFGSVLFLKYLKLVDFHINAFSTSYLN